MLVKIPFSAGIVKEITEYSNSGGWVDGNLVRFRKGFAETIGGWSKILTTPIDGVCRSLYEWSMLNGMRALGIGTSQKFYLLINDELYDISPSGFTAGAVDAYLANGFGVGVFGSGPFGGTRIVPDSKYSPIYVQPLLWSQANFGQDLIFNPHGGPIYYWQASTGPNVGAVRLDSYMDSADVPSYASGVSVSSQDGFVVAFGCTPWGESSIDPMMVRWSAQNNPRIWTPGAASTSGFQRLSSGSYIVAYLPTQQETLIWTDRALFSQTFQGQLNRVFTFKILSENTSILSSKCAISANSQVYWIGSGSFHVYNGSVSELPSAVKSHIFDDINLVQAGKIHAAHNQKFSEIWWFYPSKNSNEIDKYVIYNYAENSWSVGEMDRTSWLSVGRLSTPIAVKSTGEVYFHEVGTDADGEPMHSWIESADLDSNSGDSVTLLKRVIPDVEFLGEEPYQELDFEVLKRDSSSEPKKVHRELKINPQTKSMYPRARGRRLSVRFKNTNIGTGWRLGTMEADLQADGKR